MKSEPTIQKFMTTQPYSIEASEKIASAVRLMSEKGIRHLPVTRQGSVVGLLSDRDIKLAMGIPGLDIDALPIIDFATEKPYVIEPETPIGQVAVTMASKHYGSAIVVQNGKLVGIFTTVDACRALAEIVATRYHA